MTNGQETRRSWTRLAPSGTALVLFCSLFLNVALGSYVAVQALVAQPQRPPQRGPQQMVARLAERLPRRSCARPTSPGSTRSWRPRWRGSARARGSRRFSAGPSSTSMRCARPARTCGRSEIVSESLFPKPSTRRCSASRRKPGKSSSGRNSAGVETRKAGCCRSHRRSLLRERAALLSIPIDRAWSDRLTARTSPAAPAAAPPSRFQRRTK